MTNQRTRILLAEGGSGEVSQRLRDLFAERESGLELTVVSTVATLIPTINVVCPEVILMDLALAMPDAIDGVRRVHRCAPGVPLIVFADAENKIAAAQSLTVGAMDYLLTGFMDARALERTLRNAMARNTLEGLADLLRDSATGLYTRDALLTLGSRCQEEAQRTGGTMVLVCAYIENLNTLREGFGPGTADRALRDVAEILTQSCRRSDLVARLGEAQFALLAVDASAPSAPVLRQRVEQHIAVHNTTRSPWGPLDLRLSVGIWSATGGKAFAEVLDSVEAELRQVSKEIEIGQDRETVQHSR